MNAEKIINWKALIKKHKNKLKSGKLFENGFIFVCIIYISGIVFYTFLANFRSSSLAISIYNDEFYYWDIARNIFHGNGPIVTGVDTGFRKIAYPLLIAPFFAISDVILRARILSVFNSMLMLSFLFPLWLIAKELKLKRSNIVCLLIVAALSSDMLLSLTLMAEILYYPLFIWFVYLWLMNQKCPKLYYTILEGILCYIGYLCKEIFMAVFVAYSAIELCFPILMYFLDGKSNRKKLREYFDKRRIISCIIFSCTFVCCRIVLDVTLFRNFKAGYGLAGVSSIFDFYTFAYLIYGFLYYIAALLVASFVLPFVLPLIKLKSLDKYTSKLFCFVSGFLVILCTVISYTILIHENLGDVIPRVHLRYLAPAFPIIFLIFLKCIQERKKDEIQNNRLASWFFLLGICFFSGTIFKGVNGDSSNVDQMTVYWYRVLREKVGVLATGNSGKITIYAYAILAAVIITIFAAVLYYLYMHSRIRLARNVWLIGMLCFYAINSYYKYEETILASSLDPELVNEVSELNSYFKSQDKECGILYVNGEHYRSFRPLKRAIDTYLDCEENLYVVNSVLVRSAEAREDFYSVISETAWKTPEYIDYIIINNTEDWDGVQFIGVEKIPEISGNYYTVYKNLDSSTVIAEPNMNHYFTGTEFDITFFGDAYNADIYVKSYLNSKEEESTWIGDLLQVSVPVLGEYDSLVVRFDVAGTFEGIKSYVVRQNGRVLTEGVIWEDTGISFEVPVEGSRLSFEVEFPDAKFIDLTPDSNGVIKGDDYRKVSCALRKITINQKESLGFWGEKFTVSFFGNAYNADLYVKSGLSYKDDNFSWTSGNQMKVDIPVNGEYENLAVTLNVLYTFNGRQSYIVHQNGKELKKGIIDGAGEIFFIAPVKENYLSFEIDFPDAQVVNQVVSESDDRRMIACALSSMTVDTSENFSFSGEEFTVCFSGEEYNADLYVKSGLSNKEDNFSWTNGNWMKIDIPVNGKYGNLAVTLDVTQTFNGRQSYIIRQDGKQLKTGIVDGADEIFFIAPVKENQLSFEIEFPDAQVVNQVVPESSDSRMIACALSSMTVDTSENFGFSGEEFTVRFSGEDYNADLYVQSGISHQEDNFSWTSGNSMLVSIPVVGKYSNLSVTLDIAATFNGRQSYIVRHGDDVLKMGVVEGQDEISFVAPIEKSQLLFEIEFPDAQVVNQVVPESSDDRMLACALHSMIVSISEVGGAE